MAHWYCWIERILRLRVWGQQSINGEYTSTPVFESHAFQKDRDNARQYIGFFDYTCEPEQFQFFCFAGHFDAAVERRQIVKNWTENVLYPGIDKVLNDMIDRLSLGDRNYFYKLIFYLRDTKNPQFPIDNVESKEKLRRELNTLTFDTIFKFWIRENPFEKNLSTMDDIMKFVRFSQIYTHLYCIRSNQEFQEKQIARLLFPKYEDIFSASLPKNQIESIVPKLIENIHNKVDTHLKTTGMHLCFDPVIREDQTRSSMIQELFEDTVPRVTPNPG